MKKSAGSSRRSKAFDFDGREISKKIRKDAYPVPAVADLIEKVADKGCDVVSAIDLSNFFFSSS